MKKYRFYPLYIFLGLMVVDTLTLKIHGPGGRGNYLPTEPLTWKEIVGKLPLNIVGCLVITIILVFIFKMAIKTNEKSLESARKREREKVYSASNMPICRICGHSSENFPWGEDGKSPSFQICSCCGVQFGKEDDTLESIKEYRAGWISKGGKWFVKNETPEGWNIETQMKNIPNEFK